MVLLAVVVFSCADDWDASLRGNGSHVDISSTRHGSTHVVSARLSFDDCEAHAQIVRSFNQGNAKGVILPHETLIKPAQSMVPGDRGGEGKGVLVPLLEHRETSRDRLTTSTTTRPSEQGSNIADLVLSGCHIFWTPWYVWLYAHDIC